MSKKQKEIDILGVANIDVPGVNRSHSEGLALKGNQSKVANSMAVHKARHNDKSNASMNPKNDWLDGPVGNMGRNASIKQKKNDDFANDMLAMKRQATQAKHRQSIFVPKQASTRKLKALDTSGTKGKANNSDDEDESGRLNMSKSTESRYDLIQYNRERKD